MPQPATTTWPEELGAPSRYRERPQQVVTLTETDQGMPRARRKYTKNASVHEVGFLWNRADIARFEGWVDQDLDGGAGTFRGKNWRTDTEGRKMLVSTPQYQWVGGDTFEVTFTESFWAD